MKMTKAQTNNFYAEELFAKFQGAGLTEKLAKQIVMAHNELFEQHIADSLRDEGKFTIPGLLVVKAIYKPATKGGKLVRSPFSGEMVTTKDKPESVKVKVNGLKKIKEMAEDALPAIKKRAKAEAKASKEKVAPAKVTAKVAKEKVAPAKVAPAKVTAKVAKAAKK